MHDKSQRVDQAHRLCAGYKLRFNEHLQDIAARNDAHQMALSGNRQFRYVMLQHDVQNTFQRCVN